MIVKGTFVKLTVRSARFSIYNIHNRVHGELRCLGVHWARSLSLRDPSPCIPPIASPCDHDRTSPRCALPPGGSESARLRVTSRENLVFVNSSATPLSYFQSRLACLAKFLARYARLTFELQMRVSVRESGGKCSLRVRNVSASFGNSILKKMNFAASSLYPT